MSTATKKFVIFQNFLHSPSCMLYSTAEQIDFGLYWKISARRMKKNRVSLSLTCKLPDTRKTESIGAEIVYRIVWADGTSEIGTSTHNFHSGNLIHEGNTIPYRAYNFMLECRVEIRTTAWFEDIVMNNDKRVLLNVGGATIHVPQMILDTHFKKFQSTISKETDNSEQHSMDLSTADFMDLMFVVEGYRVLNENNVVNILSIAKGHGVDTVVEQCEQFLMNKSVKSSAELIRIAGDFSLDSLKSSVESSIVPAGKVPEKPENTVKPDGNRETQSAVEKCEQFLMKKPMKPSAELIGIANEFNPNSHKVSIGHLKVSTGKAPEKHEKTVRHVENRETQTAAINSNSHEFVISAEYDGTSLSNIFYGHEEFHSNFYWRIHIGHKKKNLSYGLECRPMSGWNNPLSLTTRIESCVISKATNLKSDAPVFQFKDSKQIFWSHFQKPASQLKVEFKVKITKTVGFGIVTNAFPFTNEAVSLIVEGKKLKFPRMFLHSHFKYFQSTLPENREEFIIEASIYDFEKLLSVLDGLNVIDDDNVVAIVRLADKYGVESVVRKCEQFLIKNSEKSPEHLLKIAEEYNLVLLKHFREQPQTNPKIMECLECPICYRTYTDIPKILPCGHTFCFECLNQLQNIFYSTPGVLLQCSICKRDFAPGSATQNYALMNIIDAVFPNLPVRKPEQAPNVQNGAFWNVPPVRRNHCEQCVRKDKVFLVFVVLSIFLWIPKVFQ